MSVKNPRNLSQNYCKKITRMYIGIKNAKTLRKDNGIDELENGLENINLRDIRRKGEELEAHKIWNCTVIPGKTRRKH